MPKLCTEINVFFECLIWKSEVVSLMKATEKVRKIIEFEIVCPDLQIVSTI